MRIAIFICNYAIGTSVAIINTCLFFAENGVKVDIFSYNNVFDDREVFNHGNIRYHALTEPKSSEGSRGKEAYYPWKTIMVKIVPAVIQRAMMNWIYRRPAGDIDIAAIVPDSILESSREILNAKSYTAFIGVEPTGLVWAELLGGGNDVPLIYWSLELYIERDPRFQGRYYDMVRTHAMNAHRKAIATIIQDDKRAELLAQQDHVPISQFIYVPVAMKGEPVTVKYSLLYDILNIPSNKKIILYVGLITHERLSLETAKASLHLPEDWVMVLHGWCPDERYKKKIKALQSAKFILSTDLLPFDQLVKVVASAHIGISLYRPSGDNERLTGFASSKMAQYLQCGLPVIVNDFESIRSIVRQYHHGICIDISSRIPEALAQINLHYEEMRRNSFKCYREKYEITPHLHKVLDIIVNIEARLPVKHDSGKSIND